MSNTNSEFKETDNVKEMEMDKNIEFKEVENMEAMDQEDKSAKINEEENMEAMNQKNKDLEQRKKDIEFIEEENIEFKEEKSSFWHTLREKIKEGWFIGIDFISQTIGTVVRNFLFSQNDQVTISNFLSKTASNELKQDENLKEKINEKEKTINQNEKEVISNEKESSNDKEEHNENESRKTNEINYAINSIFRDATVRDIFNNAGIIAEPGKDPNIVYIFSRDGNIDKKMFCMSGYDFLEGNADSLAGGLFNYKNNDKELSFTEEINEKINASISALAVIAASRYTMIDPDQSLMQEENQLLSSVNITGKEGNIALEIVVHPENRGQVAIMMNDKLILETDIGSLAKENIIDGINKVTLSQYNKLMYHQHAINSDVSFHKQENGLFLVKTGKTTKEYSFDTEHDIKELYKALNKNNIHIKSDEKEISNKAIAYTIAHLANKSLVPSIDQNGNYLNPFTGNPEPDGKAHLTINYGESGLSFEKNIPVEITSKADLDQLTEKAEIKMESTFVGNVKSLYSLSDSEIIDIAEKISDAISECSKNDLIVENYQRETPVNVQDYFEEPIEDDVKAGAEVLNKRIQNDQVFDESFEINLGDFFTDEIRNAIYPEMDNTDDHLNDNERTTEDERYIPESSDFQPDVEIII